MQHSVVFDVAKGAQYLPFDAFGIGQHRQRRVGVGGDDHFVEAGGRAVTVLNGNTEGRSPKRAHARILADARSRDDDRRT
jgi:hypothetical protein